MYMFAKLQSITEKRGGKKRWRQRSQQLKCFCNEFSALNGNHIFGVREILDSETSTIDDFTMKKNFIFHENRVLEI